MPNSMQPRYDWQKGQDAWEAAELSGQSEEQRLLITVGRQWQIGLAVILIFSLIGGSVFWFLNRRARTNTAAVEEDILRTNSLIFQAVRMGDYELLRSNLSGRDPGWASVLSNSLLNGWVYDRALWGLNFLPSDLDDSAIRIELNPEWDSAELIIPVDFVYSKGDGVTQTVKLEQTLIYRRSRERWLLAPADADFWGGRLVFEGRYITLDYPARDREIVERLVVELDSLVEDICDEAVEAACPGDFRVSARFYEGSPDVAAITSSVRFLPCTEGGFELPTPTLVGLPIDETGYEMLIDGYRMEIAALTLAHVNYPKNCDHSRLKIALLDYQLSKMGYRPLPMTNEDYAILLDERVHLEQLFYAVQDDGERALSLDPWFGDLRPYYALIVFLIEEYDTQVDEIARYIDRNRLVRDFYWSTLHNWTDDNFADNGPLEAAWEQFLIEKAAGERADTPELPDQDLRMVCYGGNITTGIAYPNGVLYELDVEDGEMTAVFPLNHTDGYIISLPGDNGAIVAEQRVDFMLHDAQVLLWEEGEPVVLFETFANLLPVSFIDFRGRGEQLLVYDRLDQQYRGYLLAECETDPACNWTDLGGFPIMSPSGERFLSINPMINYGYERQFFRSFGMGRLTTFSDSLRGKSPFWLSEERIGFIVENGRAVTALTVAGEDYPEQREVLFTLEELDPLLALDEEAVIESILSRPAEPMDLIVTVKDSGGGASIYQVNILRRWIQRLKERAFWLEPDVVYNFDLSPGGRWLVVSGEDYLIDSTAYVHLFEIAGGGVHSFEYKMVFERPMHWTMDWSAGDEWLALPDNGYNRLINPAADYQDVIVPDGVGCSGAVWVD